MQALVVYDSVFGNTEQIARGMAEAIGAEAVKIDALGPQHLDGVALLLVGSPTRGFRPTAAISAWIKGLPADRLKGVRVGAFDTRTPTEIAPAILRLLVKLFGWAAKPIADGLASKGGEAACQPEGFVVTGIEGPLREGELERAAAWARALAA